MTPQFRADFASRAPDRDDRRSYAELSREGELGFGRVALGLTVVRLSVNTEYRISHAPALTSGDCAYASSVVVRLAYTERTVHVAREFDREPCLHAEILEHENRHVALDDSFLPREIEALASGLPARFGGDASWGRNAAESEQRLEARLAAVVKDMMAQLNDDRRAEHRRRIDTPEEQARIAAVCGGRVRQFHLKAG